MPKTIWIAVCEIGVEPGDLPSGSTRAFMTLTTWADSLDEFRDKVSRYLGSFAWELISIERATPLDESRHYGAEVEDMIARTRCNADAIILGTAHSSTGD